MTKVFSQIFYRAWQLIAFAIIAIALLISVARLALPYANDYRPEIEAWLTERFQTSVRIAEIKSEWQTLGPSITLHDVQIEGLIYLGSVQIQIKTLPSIFYGNLITESLVLQGMNIEVQQSEDGSLEFSNSAIQGKKTEGFDAKVLQDWLQNQDAIRVSQAHLVVTLKNDKSYPIKISEMEYRRGGNIYQLRGFTQLPGENRIDFVLEADGLLTSPETKGQLFVDTHEMDLTQFPLAAFWQEAKIETGKVAIQVWLDWHDRRFSEGIANLSIEDFQLNFQEVPQGELNLLQSQFYWKSLADGWVLQTLNARVQSHDRNWPEPFVQVRMHDEGQQQQYLLQSTLMDLGIWNDLILAKQDLPPELRRRLLAMDTQGFLDDLRLAVKVDGTSFSDLNLNARFSELSFKAYEGTAGADNLSGQIHITEKEGNLYLDSRNAIYDDPVMFRWPLELDYLNADIEWQLNEEWITLQIQSLSLETLGATLKADGRFDIPQNDADLRMNLYAELSEANMEKTPYLLPYGVMEADLVEYLDQAVKSGKLKNVKALLRGNSNEFPFTDSSGVFAIHGETHDATYEFEPSWPALDKMQADLWFIGNSMDIRLNAAQSLGQTISRAEAVIDDFAATPTVLKVTSEAKGLMETANDYLAVSPLAEETKALFNNLTLSGAFELGLDLTIPLEGGETIVNGQIRLNDNSVKVDAIDLTAEAISGSIDIQNGFLVSSNLQSLMLGGESRISLDQRESVEGIETIIDLQGTLTTEGLYSVFDEVIPPGLFGITDYQGTITIPATPEKLLQVDVNTRLQGIESKMPMPLRKAKEIGWPIAFNYQLDADESGLLSLRWLDKVHILLKQMESKPIYGSVRFGTESAKLNNQSGIEISGRTEHLDIVEWLDYLAEVDTQEGNVDGNTWQNFYINNLSAEVLDYLFLSFTETSISGAFANDILNFSLSGDEIDGLITVPLPIGKQVIDIALNRLKISDLLAENQTAKEQQRLIADADPLPAINLRCKECFYAETQIGQTELRLSPLENGNQLKIKMAPSGILQMDLDANWQLKDDQVTTQVSGNINSANLGQLLTLIHQDAGIRDTPIKVTGELSWSGDPGMASAAKLNGKLKVEAGKGSQKQLSDRKARIFSILSLGSIARRLTLDFSDLFQDGFFYDSIEGQFQVTNGVFSTRNFSIKGTSADVSITGKTDFTTNRLEQCILVTPDLSASLPILAGWALEPVTGVVVFLMSKIFQPAIDVITSIRYQVEGSFEDPKVTEIGKSRGKATVQEDDQNPSITLESSETPFSCDDVFKK